METDIITGPIAITGATGQVGRAVRERLAPLPNEVRSPGRDADLVTAFRDAEAVVHLAGTLRPRPPDTYRTANLTTARRTVAALEGSGVQRLVFLSFLTADERSTNPYERCKAQAEQVLRASGVPTVVFRCGHILGPPERPGPTAGSYLADRGRVSVLGSGAQRLTPILLGDVADAVVRAALDPTTPTGTFELAGVETLTVDELVRVLNGGPVRIRHLPPVLAHALATVSPSLPRPLVDVMLRDAVSSEGATTAERFGCHLRGLGEVWPATADRERGARPVDA